MMFKNKKGSALMQVLVLGGVIAGIVVLLLRFSTARTVNVVKTLRKMPAKAYAEGCMAQFTAAAMLRELHGRPPSDGSGGNLLPSGTQEQSYKCSYKVGSQTVPTETDIKARLFPSARATASDGTPVVVPPALLELTLTIINPDKLE
ncbi:MAG: hypothetical protein LBG16_03895 [Elusimicrobiota bacterium]|jgi:hypothetical protein|nr:hypothetical protein [Elusimicrobiota bacterium]